MTNLLLAIFKFGLGQHASVIGAYNVGQVLKVRIPIPFGRKASANLYEVIVRHQTRMGFRKCLRQALHSPPLYHDLPSKMVPHYSVYHDGPSCPLQSFRPA